MGSLAGYTVSVVLGLALVSDVLWRRIPNLLTYPAALLLLGMNLLSPMPAWVGAIGSEASLYGAGVAFGFMFLVFLLTGRGGGDVKLATVIGAAIGWSAVIDALVWSYLFAALAGLVIGVGRHGAGIFASLIRSWLHRALPFWIDPPSEAAGSWLRLRLPMAVFMSMGCFAAWCFPLLALDRG